MNKNCENKLVEKVLKAIERGKSIEITSDDEYIHVKSTYVHNGNWISESIRKEDGYCDGFVTNCACF